MPSTRTWRGASANIRPTYTITVANTWAQGDTCTVTVDSIDFVITIGTLVTTAQVATTIKEALNGTTFTDTAASCTISIADGGASLIPQFSEWTATVSSSVVTLTSNGTGALAGKPFTVTVAENTAGSGTATGAAGTTAVSQYHFDQADNWSGNTAPVDTDTVVFDDGSIDARWGLNTYASGSTAQFATITKYKNYSGNVGLAKTNTDNNSKPYSEYRTPRYLTTDDNTAITTANLEVGEGKGSGRFMWDAGAGQVILNVFGKGTRAETGVPCILFLGSHASNVVRNLEGDLGIAFFPGETATVATLTTGSGPSSQAKTFCGTGVTLTTVTLNGGSQETDSAITTATQNAGTWVHKAGTITALTVNGGKFYNTGAATITTLTIASGGEFDAKSLGNASFTITNTIQLYKGAIFRDPNGRAGNVVIKLNNCSITDVTLELAKNKTYTLS